MSTELTIPKIRETLSLAKPTFEEMNLNKLSFAREIEFAIQAFEKNPFLLKTTGVDKVLTNIVLSGLSLNPILKYAYLVPRKVSKVYVCCVDPSYMGLCKILTDTGSVVGISATIVYEKEAHTLKIQQGMGGHASHTPYLGFEKPGRAIACYSVGVLPNGMQHVELIRPWEWENIKSRSESVKTHKLKKAKGEWSPEPTWETDEEEMIRKTCLKKHYKYLPKTERAIMAAAAFEMDNQTNGINFDEEQKQPEQDSPAAATPDAPEVSAYASDEDFEKMFVILDDKRFGTHFPSEQGKAWAISVLRKQLEKHQADETLLKDKVAEYMGWIVYEQSLLPAEEESGEEVEGNGQGEG